MLLLRSTLVLLGAVSLGAQTVPTLESLFARPYLWGTSPSAVRWAKNGQKLFFLWNAEGRRFLDLYTWDVAARKLTRLTDLEKQPLDELTLTAEEKDERQKHYLPPQPGLNGFEISADGTKAAFTYRGDLYVVPTSGTTSVLRLTRTKAPETSPRLTPDGKKLLSVRGGQVIVQTLETGQIWQATDIEGATLAGYSLSPDGKTLLYRTTKTPGRQLPLPNYAGKVVTARQINRTVAGDELTDTASFLVGIDGGKPIAVETGEGKWNAGSTVWSDDGKSILFAQHSADWKSRRLVIVDATTGKGRTVFEEKDPRWVDYGFAGWSPDGKEIFFTSEKDGWAHLYRLAADGGDPVQLTRGPWEIRVDPFSQEPQWVGGWIYYSSTEAGTAERHFYRIRPDGTGKEQLSSGEGLHIGLVSRDGAHTAMLRADERNPFDLWVNGERVTKSPLPEFYTVKWPEVRYVQFPSRGDRKPVSAKLLFPPGYAPGKKYPGIVYVHGAGIATSVLKQWGSYNELRYVYNAYLASRGYVVIDTDYRGSTGYGRDWRSDVYLHMGGKDLEDILGAVDHLAGLGTVDMNRVGIWGVSYGGFMTAMALFTSPGTFKAGSAWAGVYDWENYNAGYTAQRLNTPKSDPEAYRRSSPINFTAGLKDHLLIVHGMVDDNVLFQDAVQLTEKLIAEGKQFDHIYYPEESHGFVRDETWRDALRRTTEWFERWLR